MVLVPISVGELFDKLTILEIKVVRIADESRRENITRELLVLRTVAEQLPVLDAECLEILDELRRVNNLLWEIEDLIRDCERRKEFGSSFIELARSVYRHNDQRAVLKKRLNVLAGSYLIEEKSYADYGS